MIDVKVDDLAGIEEIDSFLDSDGVFYVLLGMNKRDSISYYSSKLTDLNKEIGFEYETLEFATHNLENLISLANLKKKIQKATEISEIIGLIDSSRSITVSVPLSLIERLRQAYINDIPFSFELNENADSIATSVEKVITDNGFHVSLDQTANVVVLTLALNNVTGNSKNAFCGYDFSIEIKDVSIGKSFYSWKKQGREAMSTYEQAQARVIYNLSKEIEKEFNEAFMENF